MRRSFQILTDNGEFLPIPQRTQGSETVVTIDNIGGWQYLILIGMQ